MADPIFLGNLFIRADAGGSIGTGHVMRMLALAQAYQRRGGFVSFICARLSETLEHRLTGENCGVIRISAKIGSVEDSWETLKIVQRAVENTQGLEPAEQWLVVDGYKFDFAYQKRIKETGISLLCVDDFNYSRQWYCDAILNQNLDAEKDFDYSNDISSYHHLLGSSYCLLRDEFLEVEKQLKKWGRIQRLLITLGGSDPDNATADTLSLLNRSVTRPLEIRVLAGADNVHASKLRAYQSHHKIEVIQNATNMPGQYEWADGIISAGGSTCWEWIYWGLPGAIVTIADNQIPIVKALTLDRNRALALGRPVDFTSTGNLKLVQWLDEPEKVCEVEVEGKLIDGFGADRLAAYLSNEDFHFRSIAVEDYDSTWVWANDPVTRSMSFSQESIAYSDHINWMQRKINDKGVWLRVAERIRTNEVLGIIRFEVNSDSDNAVISINLSPDFRGKGYGTMMIREASHLYCRETGAKKIMAFAKKENTASCRAFLKAGYSIRGDSDPMEDETVEMLYYSE